MVDSGGWDGDGGMCGVYGVCMEGYNRLVWGGIVWREILGGGYSQRGGLGGMRQVEYVRTGQDSHSHGPCHGLVLYIYIMVVGTVHTIQYKHTKPWSCGDRTTFPTIG